MGRRCAVDQLANLCSRAGMDFGSQRTAVGHLSRYSSRYWCRRSFGRFQPCHSRLPQCHCCRCPTCCLWSKSIGWHIASKWRPLAALLGKRTFPACQPRRGFQSAPSASESRAADSDRSTPGSPRTGRCCSGRGTFQSARNGWPLTRFPHLFPARVLKTRRANVSRCTLRRAESEIYYLSGCISSRDDALAVLTAGFMRTRRPQVVCIAADATLTIVLLPLYCRVNEKFSHFSFSGFGRRAREPHRSIKTPERVLWNLPA